MAVSLYLWDRHRVDIHIDTADTVNNVRRAGRQRGYNCEKHVEASSIDLLRGNRNGIRSYRARGRGRSTSVKVTELVITASDKGCVGHCHCD
jgi:hypothetical protein